MLRKSKIKMRSVTFLQFQCKKTLLTSNLITCLERAMSCASYAVLIFFVSAVVFFLRRFECRGGDLKFGTSNIANMAAAYKRAQRPGMRWALL